MLKITRDPWAHNERQQNFDEAVCEEIENMPAHRLQSVIAGLIITLVEKQVISAVEATQLLGTDWGFDE